jgi:hypothetical protein
MSEDKERGIPEEFIRGQIFQIRGSDKRKEFIKKELETSQKINGKDVEFFRDDVGFVLLEKQAKIRYNTAMIQRALSAAILSGKAPRELREFYYTLRTNPDLVKPFVTGNDDAIYPMTLRAICDLEILCDINRDQFTMGNLSKGFIYYFHSPIFGHKERKITFTEVIARSIMKPEKEEEWQCGNCENIIVVEKNAAALRMVELGLSEFTNSIIVTVGGNFNRAIWELASRFKESKNLIFMADADAYGVDMLRTIQAGTESSRHLSYKFPSVKYPKVFLAGFFPSVGESLGLPNDVEQKRPLQNIFVKQRVNFLMTHGLLDQRDYDTWAHDKTYELESLSAGFENEKGEPIGLGIYIIEYMRMFNIPVKPPMPPDDKLKKDFDEAAKAELMREIDEKIAYPKFFWEYYRWLTEVKEELKDRVYEKLLPEYEEALALIGPKEIKFHIWKQFEEDPKRASYDLAVIAHKIKTKFDIIIDWALEAFETALKDAKEEYQKLREESEDGLTPPGIDTDVEFTPVHNETNYDPNGYDLVLKRIGAKDGDVKKVRQALLTRFMDDPRLNREVVS